VSFKIEWNDDELKRFVRQKADEVLSGNAQRIERAMQAVACPEHGGHPTTRTVRTPDGFRVEATNLCCDKLRLAAEQAKDREVKRIANG
jgi:hypothetical protein